MMGRAAAPVVSSTRNPATPEIEKKYMLQKERRETEFKKRKSRTFPSLLSRRRYGDENTKRSDHIRLAPQPRVTTTTASLIHQKVANGPREIRPGG